MYIYIYIYIYKRIKLLMNAKIHNIYTLYAYIIYSIYIIYKWTIWVTFGFPVSLWVFLRCRRHNWGRYPAALLQNQNQDFNKDFNYLDTCSQRLVILPASETWCLSVWTPQRWGSEDASSAGVTGLPCGEWLWPLGFSRSINCIYDFPVNIFQRCSHF